MAELVFVQLLCVDHGITPLPEKMKNALLNNLV